MTGYTRQSAANMVTDEVIYASDLNNEFNTLQSAFDGSAGHTHDGSTGNGPKIDLTTSIVGILPALNGGIGGLNKLDATTAPTVSDDSNDGYVVGSFWVDETNDVIYFALDVTPGAAVWRRFQPYDAELTAIAGLTSAADKLPYFTGSGTATLATFTSYGRSLVDDADASAARSTLGLGTISTQAANSVNITGGSISGITDLAVADGGTGASDPSGARTNLGLVIGTDVQAYNAALYSIAGLSTSSDQMIYTTGSNAYATTALTSFARGILDDSDAASVRSTLGLVIGTNVQAYDTELAAIAGLTSAADRLPYFTGSGTAALATFTSAGRALVDDADAAAQRTTLDVYSKSEVDSLTGSGIPSGAIMYFAMDSAPSGWLKANGANISRTTYSDLFSAIGVVFGSGNGSTTFTIPDLRGEHIRGWDDGRGVDTSRSFGSWQDGQNKAHTHTVSVSGTAASAGSHSHDVTARNGAAVNSATSAIGSNAGTASTFSTSYSGAHTHSVSASGTTASDGGSEVRVRTIALLACIKY